MYQIVVTKMTKNGHSILPLVFAFLVGAFELIAGDISALKFIGTAERTSFGLDGKTIDIKFEGRFELDLDPSGKWLMTSFTDPAPNTRFRIGYDGTNTTEMEYWLLDVSSTLTFRISDHSGPRESQLRGAIFVL